MPGWFFFFQGLSYFAARMLDEMDGKQARRLRNTSSLGLILDHGCDGFSMGFIILIFMKCVQSGDGFKSLAPVSLVCFGFYVSTLEHFYTGSHYIGPGNLVSDGSVALILLFFAMGIWGNDWWNFIVLP